jgi:hypothetical protein
VEERVIYVGGPASLFAGASPSIFRNYGSPLLPAPAAPEPSFEVDTLAAGLGPTLGSAVRRQQRDVVAGGAIDFDELARSKILDPRRIEGQHSGVSVFLNP